MLKKGDVIIAAAALILVAASFLYVKIYGSSGKGAHMVAVIKQNNIIVRKIDLDSVQQPERINVQGDYNEVILAEKGRIRFDEANCPDKVCVRTGWISKKGESAVCLPNRTIIKIEGENSKVDGVAY